MYEECDPQIHASESTATPNIDLAVRLGNIPPGVLYIHVHVYITVYVSEDGGCESC